MSTGSVARRALARDRDLPLAHRLAKAVRFVLGCATAPIYLRHCDRVAAGARTYGRPLVENLGSIELGPGVLLNSTFEPVTLATGPRGRLVAGARLQVNFGCRLTADASVTLGDDVSLGPGVVIADHDEAPGNDDPAPRPIAIGSRVWLASRVCVRPGSQIGDGAVVTAGSVVDGRIPADVVAGGIPARVLRRRAGGEVASIAVTTAVSPLAPRASAGPLLRGLLVADFSIQELVGHLASFDSLGPKVTAIAAPFDQVVQTLHELRHRATEEALDFAMVWTRPEAIAAFGRRVRGERVDLDAILAEVDAFAGLLRASAGGGPTLLVASWTLPPYERGLGTLDLGKDGLSGAVSRMNLRLADALEGTPGVRLLNAERWLQAAGPGAISAKLWYMGKVGFAQSVFAEAARDVRAALRGLRGEARKLVVVDLDDTLWGGILGEVGWEGLRLGGHDALGEAFVDFQLRLKALSRRGILLAIASKNDEATALEAIDRHPEMVLRRADFAAHRIHWGDKAGSIADIVRELNLTLGGVVFIDDSPVERARVREALPEVFVPDWPEDKLSYVPALLQLRCFDAPSLTREDAARGELYSEEKQREALRAQFGSLDEWLKGLDIHVRFSRLDATNLARACQLLNKTNQMNLRTRRLGEAPLWAWAQAQHCEFWTVHVRDRVGEAGLTGLLGLQVDGEAVTIADYVLSCRVMGRRVEETLLWAAWRRARAHGKRQLVAPYDRTERNAPCINFFERSGLKHCEADRLFLWDEGDYPLPDGITPEGLPETDG
jgi:FkbH-like protein